MSSVPSSSADGPDSSSRPPRHPSGLYLLFATEMWERYGFYTAAAVIALYLQRGGFGWSTDHATKLWSNYLMFVYATPLIGGWLADRFLGFRRSVMIGGVLFILGYAALGFGDPRVFYLALILLCLGNGFFKPNISTMVGNLYPPGSPIKDSAYNIFYMGINLGALMAPLTAELILQSVVGQDLLEYAKQGLPFSPAQAEKLRRGFLLTFDVAAIGMTIGTLIFAFAYRKLAAVDRRGEKPAIEPKALALEEDLPPAEADSVSALDRVPERVRIAALLAIYGIVVVFWMVFHQNGTTMTYWADKNTAWKVSGVFSTSINAFWIVVLTVPLVKFWAALRKRGLEPSTPVKMAVGMFLTALAFFILFLGAKAGGDQTFLTDAQGRFLTTSKGEFRVEEHQVSPLWLIAAYMSISLGELMLSPMGLSMVSKVAPARMRGLMMGGWFVATAIGNKLTMIGVLWTRWYHSSFWLLCMTSALVMGLVLVVLMRPLKRAMPGI